MVQAIIIGLILLEVAVVVPKTEFFSFRNGKTNVSSTSTILEKDASSRTDCISCKGTNNSNNNNENFCTWAPNTSECVEILSQKLLDSSSSHNTDTQQFLGSRWVFLGDSTMKKLFNNGLKGINTAAEMQCTCQTKEAPRCHMYNDFGLKKKIGNWTKPDRKLEGPIQNG